MMNMKKFLATVLSAAMAVTYAIPAFADGADTEIAGSEIELTDLSGEGIATDPYLIKNETELAQLNSAESG